MTFRGGRHAPGGRTRAGPRACAAARACAASDYALPAIGTTVFTAPGDETQHITTARARRSHRCILRSRPSPNAHAGLVDAPDRRREGAILKGGEGRRRRLAGHTPAGTWPGTLAAARDDAARRLIGPRFRDRRLSADSCFSAARGKLVEPRHARPSRRWRANRRAITEHGGPPRCRAADHRTPSAWPKHDSRPSVSRTSGSMPVTRSG